jgi:hypothetical protein
MRQTRRTVGACAAYERAEFACQHKAEVLTAELENERKEGKEVSREQNDFGAELENLTQSFIREGTLPASTLYSVYFLPVDYALFHRPKSPV